jgi:chitinase
MKFARRSTRFRLLTSAAALFTVLAGGTAAVATMNAGSASAATLNASWYAQAPYVMPLDNNPPNLPAVMSATGEKAFMLAFILANGSSCSAAWDGTAPVASDTAVAGVINGVRSAGGDVSVSIGGYGGTKLGQVCSSAATTAAAYQAVVDKYALKAIDFDLEEPEYENLTAVNNELGAAQILQKNNPGIYVSVTLPGTTSGTGYFGQNALNTAKSLGFTPDNWSIMPFDGGFNGAASQQSALTSFNGLLTTTFGWTAASAWAHEGISQMNGRSDTGETFTTADFASNLTFAKSKGLGRFTFWSVNRDRQCAGGANSTTSGTCSSVVQGDWDFTKYGVQFQGGGGGGTTTPTVSPTPTANSTPTVSPTVSPTGGSTTCSGVAAWSSSTAYSGGAVVNYTSHKWTAKWWTYGDTPGGAAGVWTDNGAC